MGAGSRLPMQRRVAGANCWGSLLRSACRELWPPTDGCDRQAPNSPSLSFPFYKMHIRTTPLGLEGPEGLDMTLFKQTELCRALDTWQALVSASESKSEIVGHSVVSDSL